jgi:hypothetical protein
MHRCFALALVLCFMAAACGSGAAAPTEEHTGPATVEEVAGQEGIHRITLTPEAATRLGIEVAQVTAGPSGRTRVPYSALIYDADGAAWTYLVDGGPNVFIRHAVTVDEIVADPGGDYVLLTAGPASGTSVASVGVAELFGTEFEVGH